jgi:DnaJ domain
MSGSSWSQRMKYGASGRSRTKKPPSHYATLQVSPTAALADIKLAYRRRALEIHPDQHAGCATRRRQFQQLTAAYQVLSRAHSRREYDAQHGFPGPGPSTRGRSQDSVSDEAVHRMAREWNPASRKVYTSQAPPPEWRGKTWDHEHHYSMHYGSGMQQEAMAAARKAAVAEGWYQYKSPLGPGFTFDNDQQHNPYSKSPQGPPKVTYVYEEVAYMDGTTTTTTTKTSEEAADAANPFFRRAATGGTNAFHDAKPPPPPPPPQHARHSTTTARAQHQQAIHERTRVALDLQNRRLIRRDDDQPRSMPVFYAHTLPWQEESAAKDGCTIL